MKPLLVRYKLTDIRGRCQHCVKQRRDRWGRFLRGYGPPPADFTAESPAGTVNICRACLVRWYPDLPQSVKSLLAALR
mgnify:CR=1 FL=1